MNEIPAPAAWRYKVSEKSDWNVTTVNPALWSPEALAWVIGFEPLYAMPAAPYLYVYEYDTYNGAVHRSFRPDRWNGQEPSRAIPLYAAPGGKP